jgi:hypothetical protein
MHLLTLVRHLSCSGWNSKLYFTGFFLKDHGRDAPGICIKERGAALEPGWASSQPALATTPHARAWHFTGFKLLGFATVMAISPLRLVAILNGRWCAG